MSTPTLLVVAKAPVPGLAKTRLAATIGDDAAADLAACALLDSLDAARSTGWPVVVAMTGDLSAAARAEEVREALSGLHVVEQRGEDFADRLAAAHADAGAVHPGAPVVQIGMDTPQVTADDFRAAADALAAGHDVIGPAEDGGWWLLGLRDPASAEALREVPMSQEDTGRRTEQALGGDLVRLRTLRDVDERDDVAAVADAGPGRFSRAAAAWTTEERR